MNSNVETLNSTPYVIEAAAVTKLAQTIMAADTGASHGRATYLRSLLAGTQSELTGKPVLRITGRAKRPELETAVQAFEAVNKRFYDAVLAAVPEGLTAKDRQSKTSFARSASATLRRAISTGWNPLAHAVVRVTKAELAVWAAAHSQPRPVTAKRAEKRVMALVERIAQTVDLLPREEAQRILESALAELGGSTAVPQRIVSANLTKRERVAAH